MNPTGPIVPTQPEGYGGIDPSDPHRKRARCYRAALCLVGPLFQGFGGSLCSRVRCLGCRIQGAAAFRNDLMGIAREGSRRAYIGTANTVLGMLTLVPMLGGLVAESHVIRHALWGDGCARGIRLCDVVDSGCGVISSKG